MANADANIRVARYYVKVHFYQYVYALEELHLQYSELFFHFQRACFLRKGAMLP